MNSPVSHPGALCRASHIIRKTVLLPALVLIVTAQIAFAGSATWNIDATFSWGNAANWTPNTVPDTMEDVATFGVSNQTYIYIGEYRYYTINGIVLNPAASAYTLNVTGGVDVTLSGAGIINDSGIIQNFRVLPVPENYGGHENHFYFSNSASAGDLTQFTVFGANGPDSFGGILNFLDSSTANNAIINNLGSDYFYGGVTNFYGSSSAAIATITNGPGRPDAAGKCFFNDTSTADNAIIVNEGATVSQEAGGAVDFNDSSDAGHSTITCNNGALGSNYPAEVQFSDNSSARNVRIILYGDGQLSIGKHDSPGVTIGSLEGNGVVLLTYSDSYEPNTLSVGSNNRSTKFAGIIQDRIYQSGGSLSKVGTGTLTLTGANTYTGGTTVDSGMLLVNNKIGSGTGTGRVRVRGGTLGGKGTIAGAVRIGTGRRPGASLAPSMGTLRPVTLTIQSALTFAANGSYAHKLDSTQVKGDTVVADGLTIDTGAQFSTSDVGNNVLPPGTVLVAINNTDATPISGAFSNLADGGTITIGSNTFQADYEGGDGNDLTLTVVP